MWLLGGSHSSRILEWCAGVSTTNNQWKETQTVQLTLRVVLHFSHTGVTGRCLIGLKMLYVVGVGNSLSDDILVENKINLISPAI